jgi:YVTN family beta-propeller protein
MKHLFAGVACIAVLQAALGAASAAPAKTMNFVTAIDLPNSGDGWADYMTASPSEHRVYVGYTTESSVAVIDTLTNKVIANIADLPGAHNLAPDAKRHLGFSSDGQEDKVGVIDLRTNKLLRRIPGGVGPDAIVFDPTAHTVCCSDRRGHEATLIDSATQRVIATVPLGGAPESAVDDAKTGRIYQTVQDTNEIAVIDPHKKAVIARYKSAPGTGPTGIAFDPVHRRVFAACQNNTLVVLHEDSPNKFHVLAEVPTHDGGHAMAVDSKTHRVYIVAGGTVAVYAAVP